ncbi:MAG TPA: hypothetical protein DEH78_13375 [Solibacterales bacterium]|nr:hypothetical protein [Bryobacterales bacterium]
MTFPVLSTGAVTQCPNARDASYSTQLHSFVDGSEQAYRFRGRGLQRWTIRLDLVSHEELAKVQDFFLAMQGQREEFVFQDPWSGLSYPRCRIEGDALRVEYTGEQQSNLEITIRELP